MKFGLQVDENSSEVLHVFSRHGLSAKLDLENLTNSLCKALELIKDFIRFKIRHLRAMTYFPFAEI